MIVSVQGIRKMMTIPTDFLNDARLSIGAKGLYAQILYSNDAYSSLTELVAVTKNTEEELKQYFGELAAIGYLEVGKNTKLKHNAPKDVENVEEKVKEAEKYAETTQPKPLSIYEKIKLIIDGYELSTNVKELLLVYFTKRLNKEGRFAEAGDLHSNQVRAIIGEIVSFHISDEEQIDCVQQSIDREWFKFVKPTPKTAGSSSNTAPKASFDKINIKSGTYTQEDIDRIKERSAALEANGEQGVF